MSQENCTQSKNYKHSRGDVLNILSNVKKAIGDLEESGDNYFIGYLRGIKFALSVVEEEWTSQKD